jgi:hypothetical protein
MRFAADYSETLEVFLPPTDGISGHFYVSQSFVKWRLCRNAHVVWDGRDGPMPWPPRSPDITPLDFFLWGYVKSNVFPVKYQNEGFTILCLNNLNILLMLNSVHNAVSS